MFTRWNTKCSTKRKRDILSHRQWIDNNLPPVAVTYLDDLKRPESRVCFLRECGNCRSTSFGRTVNQAELRDD